MKKYNVIILVLLYISLLLLRNVIYPVSSKEVLLGDTNIKGDVNGDGEVNTQDYIIVRKYIMKSMSLTSNQISIVDMNNDGNVNSLDYILIRKSILNGGSQTPTPAPTPTAIAVEGISVSKNNIEIIEGESVTITATVSPSNASNKSVTWTSSNPSIVTVENGVIKGIGKGTATVTATTNNGKSATVTVKVLGDVIHFLRTGKGRYGNTIIIESRGEFAIFDASGLDNQGPVTDAYLAQLGIDKDTVIKYAIVSHMHNDHAAYMDDIISKYNVQNVIYKDYNCKCNSKGCSATDGDYVIQDMYKDIINAAKKKNIPRIDLGKKDGSKKLELGNFILSFYNVGDQFCYGDNKQNASLNVDSLGIVLTIKKGDNEMLTYLAADMQDGKYENEKVIANKIAKDYNYKTFEVYQAAHHGVNEGINDTKFKFKYPVITHSIGSLCERHLRKADGIANSLSIIYNHMKNNEKIYFSSARSVRAHYTNNGVVMEGGEVLECSDKTCKDGKSAWKLLDKNSAKRDENDKCVKYVLED